MAKKNKMTPQQQLEAFSSFAGRMSLRMKGANERFTLFGDALRSKDAKLVSLWLEHLAQNPPNPNRGNSVLHMLANQTQTRDPALLEIACKAVPRFAKQINDPCWAAGHTALHEAACSGNHIFAKALLANGANHEIKDQQLRTPLLALTAQKDDDFYDTASESHYTQTIVTLLQGGANPNVFDKTGLTPLSRSLMRGKAEWAAALLDAGAFTAPLGPIQDDGQAPLSALEFAMTSSKGRSCLPVLLEHAAESCKAELATNPNVWLRAIISNDPQCLRALDEFCANHSVEPAYDSPCLRAAINNGNPALTARLSQFANTPIICDGLPMPPITYAALLGSTACIKELLRAGADPNAPLEADPEHFDARAKSLNRTMSNTKAAQAVRLGTTPLMAACLSKDEAAAEELLRAGADLSAVDSNNLSALDCAIIAGSAPACSKLIDWAGAHSHKLIRGAPDTLGAMDTAIENNESQIAQLLCRSGYDQDQRNDQGETALITAARVNRPEIIKILLLHGANPRATDSRGRNALDKANSWENHACVKALGSTLFNEIEPAAEAAAQTAYPIDAAEWEARAEHWNQERRRDHIAQLSRVFGPDGLGRAECDYLGKAQAMSLEQATNFAKSLKPGAPDALAYADFSSRQLQAAAEGLDFLQSTLGPIGCAVPQKRRSPAP